MMQRVLVRQRITLRPGTRHMGVWQGKDSAVGLDWVCVKRGSFFLSTRSLAVADG